MILYLHKMHPFAPPNSGIQSAEEQSQPGLREFEKNSLRDLNYSKERPLITLKFLGFSYIRPLCVQY